MKKNTIILTCLLVILMQGFCFSQKNLPQKIVSPNGDTLICFTVQQADVLILKLLTKDQLLLRCVYEIKTRETLEQELNTQKEITTVWHDDSAKADAEGRRWKGLYDNAKEGEAQQKEQAKKEARRKKFWKTVAAVEAGAAVVLTTILLIHG